MVGIVAVEVDADLAAGQRAPFLRHIPPPPGLIVWL
jgi:hypothetical protein